jgi:hypothetical protein
LIIDSVLLRFIGKGQVAVWNPLGIQFVIRPALIPTFSPGRRSSWFLRLWLMARAGLAPLTPKLSATSVAFLLLETGKCIYDYIRFWEFMSLGVSSHG